MLTLLGVLYDVLLLIASYIIAFVNVSLLIVVVLSLLFCYCSSVSP